MAFGLYVCTSTLVLSPRLLNTLARPQEHYPCWKKQFHLVVAAGCLSFGFLGVVRLLWRGDKWTESTNTLIKK